MPTRKWSNDLQDDLRELNEPAVRVCAKVVADLGEEMDVLSNAMGAMVI